MKKLIALSLVLIITASLPVLASADDGVSYTSVYEVFDYDFETEATGKGIADNVADGGHTDVDGDDAAGPYNTVLNIPSTTFDLKTGLGDYKGTLIYEADYYLPIFNKSYQLLYLRDSSARAAVSMSNSGDLSLFDTNVITLNTAGWYHFVMEFDFVNQKAKLTISGDGITTTTAENVDMPSNYTTLIRIYGNRTYLEDNPFYLDNAKATYFARNYTMSAVGIDAEGNDLGADGVLYDGGRIKVNFSEKMNSDLMLAESFTLTNEFGRTIPFTGAYDAAANAYIITPSEDLSPRTEYTVTAVNLKTDAGGTAHSDAGATVTTIGAPFSIAAVSDGVSSSGSITYTVTIQNTTGTEQTGYVMAVSYDGIAMNSVGMAVVSGTEGDDYDVTLTAGGDSTVFYLMASDGTFKLIDMWSE